MSKVKTVCLIIGGVALLIAGVVLGSMSNRRRSGGTGQPIDTAGESINTANGEATTASGAVDAGAGAVSDSANINSELQAGAGIAENLIRRSRDLLAKAAARNGTNSG